VDFSSIPLGVGVIFAFFGGLVSFISPCVLPLVPAYISYMGGRVTYNVSSQMSVAAPVSRWNTFMNGVAFVAGFTMVFVLFGLLTTAFIRVVGGANIGALEGVIGRVGGMVVIFFGLHFMGALPALFARLRQRQALLNSPLTTLLLTILGIVLIVWGFSGTLTVWDSPLWNGAAWAPLLGMILAVVWVLVLFVSGAFFAPGDYWMKAMNTVEYLLYADTRQQMTRTGQQGLWGSVVMGVVFSAGWTPCIGPIYGGILTASATLSRSVGESAIWLTAYCLGLGVPFLLTALMLDGAQGLLRRLQRHMRSFKLVTGVFLVIIGLSVASGQLQSLSQQFAGQFADFSVAVEEWMKHNLEQIFGSQSGESSEGQAGVDLTDTENAIRLDSTPSASDDESPLSLVAEDAAAAPATGLTLGNRAPNFTAFNDDGTALDLYDLRGKVVLLHFWSSACSPCQAQMQQYQTLQSEDFAVIGISGIALSETLAAYRQQWGLWFPLVADEFGAIHNLYSVSVYPDNFLLNREGLIASRFGELPANQVEALVNSVLASS
jgi:cytochrome c-type biogenesis protein